MAGDKLYNTTFKTSNDVTTNMIEWFIFPNDFSSKTVLGYLTNL